MAAVTASPSTAWTAGQYVVLGNGHEVYWSGTSWRAGRAPTPPIPATGATAGTPGTYTPAGAVPPADFIALASVTASPTTLWAAGEYVVLGDTSEAYWDGLVWKIGRTPIKATSAVSGMPGSYLPAGAVAPANFGELATVTASPSSGWLSGEYIVLGDSTNAHWTGTAWQVGRVPIFAISAVAGTPGFFQPTGAVPPPHLNAMSTVAALPNTAWLAGEHVVLGDGTDAHWSGSSWVTGIAPAPADTDTNPVEEPTSDG